MVFTLASSPEVGYALPPLTEAVACGLRQVVVLLFVNTDQFVTEDLRHGVAIANNSLCLRNMTDGTIASHDVLRMVEDSQRYGMRRKQSVGYDDGVKYFLVHWSLFTFFA